MGAFLDKPKIEKQNEGGEGNNLRYGLSSMQGWRVEMEDAHCAETKLPPPLSDWSFFAVFDGHAGARTSAVCADQLLKHIINTSDDFKITTNGSSPSTAKIEDLIRTGFLELDQKMRNMPECGEDKSGSTAVSVLISPTHIFFANCGDSRGLLVRDKCVLFATIDHKPSNDIEKDRIINAGGNVMIQRVNGSLAVSRALGDFDYKMNKEKGPCEQLVSPEPEINVHERVDNDEFVILACDGIWDVMSNDEVCDFIRERMQVSSNLQEICNEVVDTCLHKGSKDNMSIVIIAFEGAPKPNEEAIKREAELHERLEKKTKEILDKMDPGDISLSMVMLELSKSKIDGLPPGGGIQSKHTKIEEIYNRLCPPEARMHEYGPSSSFWDP